MDEKIPAHDDEMPEAEREPELDPAELPRVPNDTELPVDEPVPEDSVGEDDDSG